MSAGRVRVPKRLKPRRKPPFEFVITCIGCGCDDNHACETGFGGIGCHWVSQNQKTLRGICSECVIKMFNAILFPEAT